MPTERKRDRSFKIKSKKGRDKEVMVEIIRIGKIPIDTPSAFLVVTMERHTWAFSEPDEHQVKSIEFDGREAGKGVLLGSVFLMPTVQEQKMEQGQRGILLESLIGGEKTCEIISPYIRVGLRIGLKLTKPNPIFSAYIEKGLGFGVKLSLCEVLISDPVSTIMPRQEGRPDLWRMVRIMPRRPEDIRLDPRVRILGEDEAGFVIVMAKLELDEGICWRCGSIAKDPAHNLQICPVCGDTFND